MLKDDSGQFLLLSGVIISLGMVILLIFINQSSMAGHSSSDSIMSFPKNDIRDIRTETVEEVQWIALRENNNPYLIGYNATTRGPHRQDMFNESFVRYAKDLSGLIAEKGCMVNVTCSPELNDQNISSAMIGIYYNNGETIYSEDFWVNID